MRETYPHLILLDDAKFAHENIENALRDKDGNLEIIVKKFDKISECQIFIKDNVQTIFGIIQEFYIENTNYEPDGLHFVENFISKFIPNVPVLFASDSLQSFLFRRAIIAHRNVEFIDKHTLYFHPAALLDKIKWMEARNEFFDDTSDADTATSIAAEQIKTFDSSAWTGRQSGKTLEREKADALKVLLTDVERRMDGLGPILSNENKSQAIAYIVAIRAIADAPQPPEDLIWEMITRLNSL